jgi:hypothetical protein
MYDGKGQPMYQGNAEGTNEGVRVAHVQPVYEGESSPVVDIQSGATIGFRYINFGETGANKATLKGDIPAGFTVSIRLNTYDGEVIATKKADADATELALDLTKTVTGKHAVYFEFTTEDDDSRALFDLFTFD